MDTAYSSHDSGSAGSSSTESRRRAERFAEVIDYALQVFGSSSGVSLGAQRRLGEAMGVSSTMLTRYRGKDGVDFDNLKCATVRQLARAVGLSPGTIFIWIDEGRDAAMQHQRLLSAGRPIAFSPFELLKELEASLRCTMTEQSAISPKPPQLAAAELAAAIEEHRSSSPALFDRLSRVLALDPLLADLPQRTAISDQEWQQLAELLDSTEEELQQQFMA